MHGSDSQSWERKEGGERRVEEEAAYTRLVLNSQGENSTSYDLNINWNLSLNYIHFPAKSKLGKMFVFFSPLISAVTKLNWND